MSYSLHPNRLVDVTNFLIGLTDLSVEHGVQIYSPVGQPQLRDIDNEELGLELSDYSDDSGYEALVQ